MTGAEHAPTAATTLVIPTLGRPSLVSLLEALGRQTVPVAAPIVVVDDRGGDAATTLPEPPPALDVRVVRAGGRGPARARNLGWRRARTAWVSFLDDDVVPDDDWHARLLTDLVGADRQGAVGSTGRVRVPLPTDRRPTDWERGTHGLESARWITADISYRRASLAAVGGFDERFPRAFREDADLALRLGADRGTVVAGARQVTHPVRPAGPWASVRQQAGNADDVLMRVLHGPRWRRRAQAPTGRRTGHLVTTLGLGVATAGGLLRRPWLAAAGGAVWGDGTAEFAWSRIAPGPRDAREVGRMVLTSGLIPPLAAWHVLAGMLQHRGAEAWRGPADVVLLDRDGTLLHDVPYNHDPRRVRPVPGARAALDRLRAEGVRLAVVTNQSGVGRGLLTRPQVDRVNLRMAELLGPFDAVLVCPHAPADGCGCRKPAPGLVKQACEELGADPATCVMVGDIGADVEAAEAAGVRSILVPTPVTRAEEVAAAPRVARTLSEAVTAILGGRW